ncbi:MAG: ABC transporter ATP-binding protein [Tepidiforma sp.]|jgi:urea transport system ATP-binding protein|uniref:Urea ABC transporter ATP-binding subunit UrtE n=1 Tax=Tepidiforma bonchosmolovskayae TaxID=2601677 RepID=A0ABX6C3I2_9CHLR|nr:MULTISPECIES: urea ABC transporter ATP-binding subunit UrtE [Tepidiforma]QFG03823.1 urea ABC transporter ATP-binding subunit UrtE [Tepidiforma bonchosmolovskayae]GIW15093.1 MAG: ABC transporter ATP-binding protein [Tepidiforma sp.]
MKLPAALPVLRGAAPPADTAGALLSVQQLSVAYGQSEVLHGVSVRVEPGQVVCVMGRNGAGKTTLLKGIIGILRARSGRVLFDGRDLTAEPAYSRAHAGIGYVPQGRGIFPQLSVLENLLIGLEPVGGRDDGQLEEVFTLFPVLKQMARRTAGVLSGGQQQQLAIGRALMGRPRLLLLDEPTEGIQPSIVEQIEGVIASLKGRLAVLLVEQFLDFALANAEYCYVLESGSVTMEGPPAVLDAQRLREALAI